MSGQLKRALGAAQEWPRVSGLVGGSLLAVLYLALRFESLQGIGELVDHSPGLMKDFYDYFYRTGRSLGEGGGPVGGFLYPPLFGLLMVPFAWLSPRHAQFLWGALEALSTLGLAALSARLAPPRILWTTFASLATIISTPALHNFKWGQMGVPLALIALIAVEVYSRSRPLSALLISLSASIKLYPAVLLSVFIRRRDFRSLVTCLAGGAALIWGVPWLVLGQRRTARFFEKTGRFLTATVDTTDPNSQSVANWMARMFGAVPDGVVLSLAASVAFFSAFLLLRARDVQSLTLDRFTAFLSLAWTPFVVPTSWANYFAFLPCFASFLAGQAGTLQSRTLRTFVQMVAISVFLCGSFVAVDLCGNWAGYVGKGVLLAGNLACAGTAMLILAVRDRDRLHPRHSS